MLSYQHSYHAGCFADVMKHALLARVLVYLIQKDRPLLYLDTHSGRGEYNLRDKYARKTNEAAQGIQLVWEKRSMLSSLFSPYFEVIESINQPNILKYYPGSPAIASYLLRSQDRLIFCELHPTEFQHLMQLPTEQRRIFLKKEDGFNCVNALLPALERRGLVFIDPSYEQKKEYQQVVQAIKAAYKRSDTMTYCLWYPLISNRLPKKFLQSLASINAKESLRLEFYGTQKVVPGMTGSGLWIINPPYTLAEEGKIMLEALTKIMTSETSGYLVDLTPKKK